MEDDSQNNNDSLLTILLLSWKILCVPAEWFKRFVLALISIISWSSNARCLASNRQIFEALHRVI